MTGPKCLHTCWCCWQWPRSSPTSSAPPRPRSWLSPTWNWTSLILFTELPCSAGLFWPPRLTLSLSWERLIFLLCIKSWLAGVRVGPWCCPCCRWGRYQESHCTADLIWGLPHQAVDNHSSRHLPHELFLPGSLSCWLEPYHPQVASYSWPPKPRSWSWSWWSGTLNTSALNPRSSSSFMPQ